MTKKQTVKSGQTLDQKSLTSDQDLLNVIDMANVAANDPGQTNSDDNQTGNVPSLTKPKKSQTTTVKWSITTEKETRTTANKAAQKAGLKLYDWIDRTLREKGIEELTNKPNPPARPEDLVKDILAEYVEKMETSQEARTKAQSELIEKQGEQIAELTKAIQNQPRSLKEMLFGRKDA